MNMYKDINKALSLQNQELRQEVQKLKNEIVLLNRKLLAERYVAQSLKTRHIALLRDVSKTCNGAMYELQRLFEEQPDDLDKTKLSLDNDRSMSKRSVRLVQPTPRKLENADSCKENIDPLGENDGEGVISYVQTRRRRRYRSSDKDEAENIQSTPDEATSSDMDLDGPSLTVDETIEDPLDRIAHQIHTITEENTADITCSRTCLSAKSLSYSTLQKNLSNQISLSPPSRVGIGSEYRQQAGANSLLNAASSTNRTSQLFSPSINRSERTVLEEDTILANFYSMKAPCSTPYKAKTNIPTRKCYIRLKRLTGDDLKKYKAVTTIHGSERQGIARDQVVLSRNRVSSPCPPSRSLMEISSSIRQLNNLTRPKRTAAPVNLKEPKINCKLRREK